MKRSILTALCTLATFSIASTASAITLTKWEKDRRRAEQNMSLINAAGSQPNCQLQYGGGPLIDNAKVFLIFWGTTNNGQYSQYASKIQQFYTAVVQSPYIDMLQEYNVSGYSIGRGTFTGVYADSSPPSKTSITDETDIPAYIKSLISGGKIPMPDSNTLLAIHFPASVSITMQGQGSCQVFCAYHQSTTVNNQLVRYMVIPDVTSGGCAQGCGMDQPFNNLTATASHELAEAITDPDQNSAWVDTSGQNCGEIGDICDGYGNGTAGGFTVQLEWSNKMNSCIDHDPAYSVNDFTVSVDATTSVEQGASGTATVTTMTASGSTAQALTLSVSNLPNGVTGTFNPASPMSGSTSTLTLNVGASVAPGDYMYTVTAKGGSTTHTANGKLTVTMAMNNGGSGGGNGGSGGGNGGSGGGNGGSGGHGGGNGGSGGGNGGSGGGFGGSGGGFGGSGGGVGSGGGSNGNGNGNNGGVGCAMGNGAGNATGLVFVTLLFGLVALVSRRRA